MQDDQGRLDVLRVRDWRVTNVSVGHVNRATGETTLAAFKDGHVAAARIPVDRVVHRDHLGQRRAGNRGLECIGLRD